ncbi:MAG: AbrB/MazE/SpoVT family DNA-binding domain-containing protein [Candidatus Marinimicrobia bacterium]|nr:AbrB/MazE/SpoVT family DNA-binding domain-containing protein [Candidatus Neomarinimicrobiota bacterium]
MTIKTKVKISSKGQITIPKKMRDKFDSDYLEVEQKDKKIILQESPSVDQLAGSLNKHADNKQNIPKNEVWSEHVKEKYSSP